MPSLRIKRDPQGFKEAKATSGGNIAKTFAAYFFDPKVSDSDLKKLKSYIGSGVKEGWVSHKDKFLFQSKSKEYPHGHYELKFLKDGYIVMLLFVRGKDSKGSWYYTLSYWYYEFHPLELPLIPKTQVSTMEDVKRACVKLLKIVDKNNKDKIGDQ